MKNFFDPNFNVAQAVFARLENAADTRYQEILNYGTAGRAIYAGFNATW